MQWKLEWKTWPDMEYTFFSHFPFITSFLHRPSNRVPLQRACVCLPWALVSQLLVYWTCFAVDKFSGSVTCYGVSSWGLGQSGSRVLVCGIEGTLGDRRKGRLMDSYVFIEVCILRVMRFKFIISSIVTACYHHHHGHFLLSLFLSSLSLSLLTLFNRQS